MNARGLAWFRALTGGAGGDRAVRCADVAFENEKMRVVAVVANPASRFPRARAGQVGIEEGWDIATAVHAAVEADRGAVPRAIVAIVDVPGQAFGFHEEALGLHESLAAAVDAYASARLAGHPVVALIVGKAISGAFLAHGLQAGSLLALDDDAIEVHVMSQASVARVTRRSEEEVAALAKVVPSTSRDVRAFASLGAIDRLLKVANADRPSDADLAQTKHALLEAIRSLRKTPRGPVDRLANDAANASRASSIRVRQLLEAQWDASA